MFFRFPILILSVFTFWLSAHCSKAKFGQRIDVRGAIAPSAQAEGAKSARFNHGRGLSKIRVKGFPPEYTDIQTEFNQNAAVFMFRTFFA